MALDINTKKLKKNAFRVSKVRGVGASRIRVPGGYLNARVLGMVQEIAEKYGNGFDVDNYRGKELVVIAGGTGLSPTKGVVDYFAQHTGENVSTTLIAGFTDPSAVLFRKDFEFWKEKINVIQTVDGAPEGYDGPVGLVTKYIPDLKFKDISNAVFICVGPPVMIRFAVAEILKLGVAEEQIWVSHERKMCCGLGKCGHCKVGSTYICLDGPVFNYVEGKNLLD